MPEPNTNKLTDLLISARTTALRPGLALPQAGVVSCVTDSCLGAWRSSRGGENGVNDGVPPSAASAAPLQLFTELSAVPDEGELSPDIASLLTTLAPHGEECPLRPLTPSILITALRWRSFSWRADTFPVRNSYVVFWTITR